MRQELWALEQLNGVQGVVQVEALVHVQDDETYAGGFIMPAHSPFPVAEFAEDSTRFFSFLQQFMRILIRCHNLGVTHGDLKEDVFRVGHVDEKNEPQLVLIDWNMAGESLGRPEFATGTAPFGREDWSPNTCAAIDKSASAALLCHWVKIPHIFRAGENSLDQLMDRVEMSVENIHTCLPPSIGLWRRKILVLSHLLLQRRDEPLEVTWNLWLYSCWFESGLAHLLPEHSTLLAPAVMEARLVKEHYSANLFEQEDDCKLSKRGDAVVVTENKRSTKSPRAVQAVVRDCVVHIFIEVVW